jgi:hypothetical protein
VDGIDHYGICMIRHSMLSAEAGLLGCQLSWLLSCDQSSSMLHSPPPRAVLLPLSQQQDMVLTAAALLNAPVVLQSSTSLKAQLLDLLVVLSSPDCPFAGGPAHQHFNCVNHTAQLALQQQQDLQALQTAGWWVALPCCSLAVTAWQHQAVTWERASILCNYQGKLLQLLHGFVDFVCDYCRAGHALAHTMSGTRLLSLTPNLQWSLGAAAGPSPLASMDESHTQPLLQLALTSTAAGTSTCPRCCCRA